MMNLWENIAQIQSVYDRFSINDSEFESNMKSADSIKELKTMYQKGIAYMEEKNYPDAIEVFEEILENLKTIQMLPIKWVRQKVHINNNLWVKQMKK